MGKTPPKEKEADGSPRKKAPRVDDAALITDPVATAPSPTGKTPPKGEEEEGSPRKKAARLDDTALATVPVASVPSPAGKTPPKGEEAQESPRKKAPRLGDAGLATGPGASEPNPTGEAPPKGEAEGSPPKRSRSPRNKSPRRQGKWPAAALPLPTVPQSSELIVEVAGRASDEKRCKCNHVITHSAIEELVSSLDSKEAWTCCDCRDEDKAGTIVKTRPDHLLICVTCYDHLCCGVGSIAYPFGQSRGHAQKKKHWFAVMYCDPERGYCFKCKAEVPMPAKFGEGDNEVGLERIHDIASQKLLALPPSVGQTEAEVNPKKVEMTGKVQAESHLSGFDVDLADKWPSYESRSSFAQGYGKVQAESRLSGFSVDLADKWPSYESRSSDARGYAIRGILNLGNTCYMSAVLQCLFVLGKLQQRMLALDRPKGPLAKVLKELFVEASAAGGVLNPNEVLKCVRKHCAPRFGVGAMEDSHDLLTALRELWNQGEENDNWLSNAPTVMDSIFRFEMAQTLSCKKCGHLSLPVPYPFWDLSMGYPSKGHPTKSAALPQTNERPRSRNREIVVQLFPADVQRNLKKMQKVSASGYSDVIGSDMIVEETHKPLEVDSTQTQCISQRKDVVHSPLQIQEGKSVDSLTADSVSIRDFLLLFSEDHQAAWRCPNCAKDHEESSASQSKNGEQTVGSGNEDTTVDGDQIEQSDRTPCHSKESECQGGILPAEKQTDLLGTNQSADASKQLMMHLETVKQSEQACTPYLLKDSKNEQKDDVRDNIMFHRFTMLPPVLTLHLKRARHDTVGSKISGPVRFMEYLDVEQFMDPSFVDKGSTHYRLAGVVEHIGKGSLKDRDSHYIAYVRARRLGNQQEGSSSSSSWFRADDRWIRQVTLEQVLNSEAYILFYERIEDQDISGMPEVAEDIVNCWEMIQSDEIVNCNPDLEDRCYELKLGDISWSTQLIYNKYNKYAVNVLENNRSYVERLQQGCEWLGQFAPLVDHLLPIPVCSLAANVSSRISQARKAAALMGQVFELLQSIIPPPEHMAALVVANEMQARDAVARWNYSGQSKWYFVVLDDGVDDDQARAVKELLDELDARELLFDLEFCDSD